MNIIADAHAILVHIKNDNVEFVRDNVELVHYGKCNYLHIAIEYGALNIVEFFLDECKCNPDSQKSLYSGQFPLQIACKTFNFEMVKLLLEHGANINFKTNHFDMHHQLMNMVTGDDRIFKLLIEHGGDPIKSGAILKCMCEGNANLIKSMILEYEINADAGLLCHAVTTAARYSNSDFSGFPFDEQSSDFEDSICEII